MTSLIKRWQKKTIQEAIKTRRVLLLSGARQCGKTTLAKQVADKDTLYLTLDDLAMRNLAREDPHGFVKTRDGMLIIDEIQRAPDLLSAIKLVVDINTRPGQFLLTGSANLQSLPTVQESLAGRIRKVRLRTLSQGEIIGASPDFLKHAFNQSFAKVDNSSPDRQQLLNLAFRGGYPEILHFNEHECQLWHNDYISALLERDLADITKITQHSAMRELIQILAGWSGNYMDITAMSSKLSIRRPTIESYINALEALYLVERLAPWSKTDYERVGKQSKFYMCDSGIMTSLLRWHRDQIEYDPDRSGKLIETFIHNELAAQIDVHSPQYQIFHYRDREKREIDFIIERDDQALLGIEVKAGSALSTADFKHLKWFKANIAKERTFIGIVLYSGTVASTMGENLWAVPYSALWPQ